jgi:dTDP-3-amino-3,4,6-trideoxy-alpha-D-glucose transaminase
VHLYGQAADLARIAPIASRYGVPIVEDCCQAHLATAAGRRVGTWGVAGAFSFYPTKNLGALGDAGAVVTNDRALAERVKRLRNGGQTDRYHHDEPGVNSRLDELQAAVLRARLPFLPRWTARRRSLAASYRERLHGVEGVECLPECDSGHVYHLFVVRSHTRDELQRELARRGVETLVHYPIPIPRQRAFSAANPVPCPVADRVCSEVLSIPLYPSLADAEMESVAAAVAAAVQREAGAR